MECDSDIKATPPLIAVVDDDPSFLRATGRLLRVAGYTVRMFASPSEFLESLTSGLPDCLVVDLHMPGMTGLQLQEFLVSQGVCLHVILVTAQETVDTRERARRSGIAQLLLKPFDGEVLLETLKILGLTVDAHRGAGV